MVFSPYTSSSSTISAYGPIGAGIPGKSLDHVVGVLKAYSTCVGAGPFVAEKGNVRCLGRRASKSGR